MYVIVETNNGGRGSDALTCVFGPFDTEEDALNANRIMRAKLPAPYKSHEDYPVDYTVMRVWPEGDWR